MYVDPHRADALNVLDFGFDPTGRTSNDAGVAAIFAFINTSNSQFSTVFFPEGTYRFDQPWPSIPPGVWIRGAGVGCSYFPRFYTGAGSRLFYTGAGSFITFKTGGVDTTAAHRGGLLDLEILAANPNGHASYPNIAEVGVDIIGDAQVTVAFCRLGQFKYAISVDGGEGVWLHDLTFDTGQFVVVNPDTSWTVYTGYADMNTDRDEVLVALTPGTQVTFSAASGGTRGKLTRSTGSWLAEGFRAVPPTPPAPWSPSRSPTP